MQSKAANVDAYLDEVPVERRPALERLRALCLEHLAGFEEGMAYGAPAYSRDGVVEVGFASQKHNIALYILRNEVMDAHRATFPRSQVGKGCIRYHNPARIDFELVARMLAEAATASGEICG